MTLLTHPQWTALVPHLYIQGRQSRGLNGARHRIEVRSSAPPHVLQIRVPCAACGRLMSPVRARLGETTSWFVSVTCPLEVSVACARRPAARQATAAIRAAVEAYLG